MSRHDLCLAEFAQWLKIKTVRARDLVCLGRDYVEVGEGAKGRERFATEAEGVEARKVVEGGQLRGVVFQGYIQDSCVRLEFKAPVRVMKLTDVLIVIRGNSAPVVLHLDRVQPVVLESDLCEKNPSGRVQRNSHTEGIPTDRGCACIETVLDELFGDGAQVDNDLAGLDLVDLMSAR